MNLILLSQICKLASRLPLNWDTDNINSVRLTELNLSNNFIKAIYGLQHMNELRSINLGKFTDKDKSS